MIKFANLSFRGLIKKNLLSENDSIKVIIPTNAELIVKAQKNKKFNQIISSNYSTFDGQIPFFIALKQNPLVNIEKISGSDLIYDFCQMAKEKRKKIFLLGGYEISNTKAVEKLKQIYYIDIQGFSPAYKPYPFESEHNELILSKIKTFKPDILFVGFGAIKQEFWIDEHKKQLEDIGVKWVVGSGGTFEFVSGELKRAPLIFQKMGLEGFWRFISEPKWFRLKRLLISLMIFKYYKEK